MNNKKGIIFLFILIQISAAFACPPMVESYKVQKVFPSQVQISWTVIDSDGLMKLELFEDGKQIYKENLNDKNETGLYQISDDNRTHKYDLTVYCSLNLSSTFTKERGGDSNPPEITSEQNITSKETTLTITTNEPAICNAGFDENSTTPLSTVFQKEHSVALALNEGLNRIFVKCTDEEENEMLKAKTINYILDSTKPSKVTGITYAKGAGGITLSWQAASDENGIGSYNIYNSIQQLATTKETSWVVSTQDDVFFIAAVDKLGNEGEQEEFRLGRELLLTPLEKIDSKETAEKETAKEGEQIQLNTTTISIIAWSIFGTLLVVFIGWKIYEYKSDKHGLRSYLKKRRKMRDIEVYKKHE